MVTYTLKVWKITILQFSCNLQRKQPVRWTLLRTGASSWIFVIRLAHPAPGKCSKFQRVKKRVRRQKAHHVYDSVNKGMFFQERSEESSHSISMTWLAKSWYFINHSLLLFSLCENHLFPLGFSRRCVLSYQVSWFCLSFFFVTSAVFLPTLLLIIERHRLWKYNLKLFGIYYRAFQTVQKWINWCDFLHFLAVTLRRQQSHLPYCATNSIVSFVSFHVKRLGSAVALMVLGSSEW